MSVYTPVSKVQLEAFLHRYAIGTLIEHRGISAGITNTNYAVTTASGDFILTLFEHIGGREVDYILGLQHHLAEKGVRCAAPEKDRKRCFSSDLNGRPAAIVRKVPGEVCKSPSIGQCAQIGAELARFHLAGRDYKARRSNPRGLVWWNSMPGRLGKFMGDADRRLLADEIHLYRKLPLASLPNGTLHADLFHDNVLFDGDSIGGIIDFDYACHDILVFDLGVAINDWCIRAGGELDQEKVDALTEAYHRIRPMHDQEREALPVMLRAAALRFWLSRLYDRTYPASGELTFVKDPGFFRNMLLSRRNWSP
ncbi:MAG: homoserine kinase [Gammaproteobacteria bacterium]